MDTHNPRFCGKCGSLLPNNVKFCVQCGFPVKGFNQPSGKEKIDNYKSESNQQRLTKLGHSRTKKVGIVLSLVIISVIILGAIGSTTAQDKNPQHLEGLTQSQITEIRLIKDQCKQGAMMAYSQGGATVEEIYNERCNQVVENKIRQYKEENTIKNAIETRNVSLCDNVSNNLICIKEYALELNEPQICNNAGHVKTSCIQEVAKKYDQIETCNLLEDNTSCIYLFAKANNDTAVCDMATNPNECIKSYALTKGPSSCELLSGSERKECYLTYLSKRLKIDSVDWSGYTDLGKRAIDCRNPAIGSSLDDYRCRINAIVGNDIPKEITKDVLLDAKIKGYGGLNICKIIDIPQGPAETSNDQCLSSLAVFFNDYAMCDQIKNQDRDFRSTCYGTIAFTNNFLDMGMCSLPHPTLCYVGNAYRLNDKSICDDWEKLDLRDVEQFRNQCARAIHEKNKS